MHIDAATDGYSDVPPLIKHIVPGGSADLSGQLRVGDVVQHIDGVPTAGLSISSIVELVTGPPGTHVRFGVARGLAGGEEEIVMMRQPTSPALDDLPFRSYGLEL